MQITPPELRRFRLEGKLGEGADSEVFAATDTETGLPVVVKRPHPTLITRRQHRSVERRIANVIALRQGLGENIPHVTKMVGYSGPSIHDAYFGDDLDEEYRVIVEEQAAGVPLVGSAIDGIKRHPIGAPQNLFGIHQVVRHSKRGRFSIVRDLLEVAEAFHAVGTVILDMRPQNIYFEPEGGNITVIDIGGVTQERPGSGGRQPLDLHDFYLELFKWYVPIDDPPADSKGYRHPIGMETIPMFHQNLDSMIRRHEAAVDEAWHSAALDILHKVKNRAYPSIQAFKSDFEPYLSLLDEKYEQLSERKAVTQAWTNALQLLKADHWRKFRFNPRSLAGYDT